MGIKSNKISLAQELLAELDMAGCMIVVGALNYQKQTANKMLEGKSGYAFQVKNNQNNQKMAIADYVHCAELREKMDTSKCL